MEEFAAIRLQQALDSRERREQYEEQCRIVGELKKRFPEDDLSLLERVYIILKSTQLSAEQINEFFNLYYIIQQRFPQLKNLHNGFLSTAEDFIDPRGRISQKKQQASIRHNIAGIVYTAGQHLKTLQMIVERESQIPKQRTLIFNQQKNQEDNKTKVDELEDRLYDLMENGSRSNLIMHDQILAEYLRLTSQEKVQTIIIGDTISTFLNLNPKLKTRRCTAGRGMFRKTTYQYALYDDISIIDLCFNAPENKVAELMTVNCKDFCGRDVLLVETAEAGNEAFALPDYEGMPAWTCLLLEEVVDRAYSSKRSIFFSTNLDFKPQTNIFLTTAARMLMLTDKVPTQEKYKPRFIEEPLKYNDFLTTVRWRGNRKARSKLLRKEYPKTRIIQVEKSYLSGRAVMAGIDQPIKYTQTKEVTDDTGPIKDASLFPEIYLGAWNSNRNFKPNMIAYLLNIFGLNNFIDDESLHNLLINFIRRHLQRPKKPFYYRGHPNINNGKGFVNGFEYKLTEENYRSFKQKMQEIKEYIGIVA